MSKTPIALSPVDSSNVKAIGYDPTTKTLAVQFNSGAVGHYANVEAKEHLALVAAPSVGSHLAKHIKPRKAHTDASSLYPKPKKETP